MSTTSNLTILGLAKQGDSKAISALINRQLRPKGITAKVSLKGGCLQVLVESSEVPAKDSITAFMKKGLTGLKINHVKRVKIYGKKLSEDLPDWDYKFDLFEETNPFNFEESGLNEPIRSSNRVQDCIVDSKEADCYFEATGKNGKIKLRTKRIVISREGFWGFVSQGSAGVKEIPISNVTAVQFKPAGDITVGYLQFSIIGGLERQGGVFKAVNDENTVTFLPNQQPNFEEVKRYVDSVLDNELIALSTLTYTDPTTVKVEKPFWEKDIFSSPSNTTKQISMRQPEKTTVGLCAIFLGWLGVHKFMLGYTLEGAILLCITVLSVGNLLSISVLIGIVEGVIYLRKSDINFHKKYVAAKKGWF